MEDPEELQVKLEDLVPRQKNIVDNAFERIMTEEWSADMGLVVPRVKN